MQKHIGFSVGIGLATSLAMLTISLPSLGCETDMECKGDRVCVSGECMLPTSAPPAEPATSPSPATAQPVMQPPPASPQSSGEPTGNAASWQAPERADSDDDANAAALEGFVFVPHIGFRLAGSGTMTIDVSCSGSYCTATEDEDYDYDDQSGFVLGADAMYHVVPALRLGAGFLYGPSATVSIREDPNGEGDDDRDKADIGGNLSAFIVAEGVIATSPTVLLMGRLFGGLMALTPKADLKDSTDEAKSDCKESDIVCHSKGQDLPFGPTVGAGIGAAFAVSPSIRLRGDLVYQWYELSFGTIEYSLEGGTKYSGDFGAAGSRILLLAGAEF